MTERPFYDRASKALQAAHDACFKHPDRGVLGMSHGPFSGVNEALAIVAQLERENAFLKKLIEVVQLQPDTDCPGLWIGFKSFEDRARVMAMLRALPARPAPAFLAPSVSEARSP